MEIERICEKIYGEKIVDASRNLCTGNDEITIKLGNGKMIRFYHYQNCCENVWLEGFDYPVEDMIGANILSIELRTEEMDETERTEGGYLSGTWSYLYFNTTDGTNVLRWCGTSNGYYSETIDWEIIRGTDETV